MMGQFCCFSVDGQVFKNNLKMLVVTCKQHCIVGLAYLGADFIIYPCLQGSKVEVYDRVD